MHTRASFTENLCPFCRHPIPKERLPNNSKMVKKEIMKRVAVEDPVALRRMGCVKYEEGDYQSAFEYLARAAELGDVDSHHRLSILYTEGKGDVQDLKKKAFHLEEACIMGHIGARCSLAGYKSGWKTTDRIDQSSIISLLLPWDVALRRKFSSSFVNLALSAKKSLPQPFVHNKLLWVQRKARREIFQA